MKTIHFFGKRGMGDIIATLSYFLKNAVRSDCHIIFHYPPNHKYKELIDDIMLAFCSTNFIVTYEVDESWFSVKENRGIERFGQVGRFAATNSSLENCWWFTGTYIHHVYHPFKTTWKSNKDGPIALALNHEAFNKTHPIIDKFFSDEDDQRLRKLVDNKNYFSLGLEHSFQRNLEILSSCRYVLGIEGGWTHASNATRTPFICVANKRDPRAPAKVHGGHPHLEIIPASRIDSFLI